ncbi:MAG: DUF4012 domain-containing protein [Pleurocapsa minor GSE-CHR-MK-17-07R]|jgi:hypothetical protein|nr:DUF4012 domain-containing protein [Pleurocapsa minor GSE-CHR-MK 17-07R]
MTFSDYTRSQARSRTRRRILLAGIALAIVLALGAVVVLGARLATSAVDTLNQSRALVTALERGEGLDEARLRDALVSARETFQAGQFALPLTGLLGENGCLAREANALLGALAPHLPEFTPLIMRAYDALGTEQGRASLTRTPNSVPIASLRDAIPENARADAAAALAALPPPTDCAPTTAQGIQLQRALDGGYVLLKLALGIDWRLALRDGAHWLIVLNNSDELRASGGFTTAYIDIRVAAGVLTWEFHNSYDVDNLDRLFFHPQSPEPMREHMALTWWMFRDANWSPDHPTNAQFGTRIFQLDQQMPAPIGFITFNMSGLSTLAETFMPPSFASGPLRVNGVDFMPDNAAEQIRLAWNVDAMEMNSDAPERKQFVLDFAASLATSIATQLAPLDLPALGLAAGAMLERRDVMLYSADPSIAEFLRAQGWDGRMLTPDSGDYLMIVDSNLGYNKVSPRVTREFAYSLVLPADTSAPAQARVDLTYTNVNEPIVDCTVIHNLWIAGLDTLPVTPTYADRMTACYWNYVRVFFPAGGVGRGFSGHDAPAEWFPYAQQAYRARLDAWEEAGHPGLGTLLVLPPDETRTVSFEVELPGGLVREENGEYVYTLTLQRQAGAPDATVTVNLTLPPGTALTSANVPVEQDGDSVRMAVSLAQDAFLEVRYR